MGFEPTTLRDLVGCSTKQKQKKKKKKKYKIKVAKTVNLQFLYLMIHFLMKKLRK